MPSPVRSGSMSNTPYQPVFTGGSSSQPQPLSPRETQFFTPETEHLQLHDDSLPAGAAQPRFMGQHNEGFRGSFASSNPTLAGDYPDNSSSYALNEGNKPGYYTYNDGDLNDASPPRSYGTSPYLNEKRAFTGTKSRKKAIIIGSLVAAAVIIAAAVGIYFGVVKPKQNDKNSTSGNASSSDTDSSSGSSNSTGSGGTKNLVAVTGTDGSTITTDSGSTFTYKNSFGGTWYFDPTNPLVSGARAQSWTPALNETFNFGEDIIRGSVTTPTLALIRAFSLLMMPSRMQCQPRWLARNRTGEHACLASECFRVLILPATVHVSILATEQFNFLP